MHHDGRFATLIGLLFLGIASVVLLGCHEIPEPVSKLNVADESTANQLLGGFWWIEDHSWRWTAREFAVALQPPAGSEQSGATLQLHLYIPDSQIESLGALTLTGDADGELLDPQTFTKGGSYIYTRHIPKKVLNTSLLPIKFNFDQAMPPGRAGGRELAAVVTSVELETN